MRIKTSKGVPDFIEEYCLEGAVKKLLKKIGNCFDWEGLGVQFEIAESIEDEVLSVYICLQKSLADSCSQIKNVLDKDLDTEKLKVEIKTGQDLGSYLDVYVGKIMEKDLKDDMKWHLKELDLDEDNYDYYVDFRDFYSKEKEKCHRCRIGKMKEVLTEDVIDWGEQVKITGIPVSKCTVCGEEIYSQDTIKAIEDLCDEVTSDVEVREDNRDWDTEKEKKLLSGMVVSKRRFEEKYSEREE